MKRRVEKKRYNRGVRKLEIAVKNVAGRHDWAMHHVKVWRSLTDLFDFTGKDIANRMLERAGGTIKPREEKRGSCRGSKEVDSE